jgi:prepilin peptidase CpaA
LRERVGVRERALIVDINAYVIIIPTAIVFVCLVAALYDWRSGKIPNWLTLPPLVVAPLCYALVQGWSGAASSLLGLAVCGATPYLLFARGAMGGGDVKLFAALGAIAGVKLGIEIELLSFIVASTYALGRLVWEGKMVRTLLNTFWLFANLVLPSGRRREIKPELMATMRMGAAVLAAAILAVYLEYPMLWM